MRAKMTTFLTMLYNGRHLEKWHFCKIISTICKFFTAIITYMYRHNKKNLLSLQETENYYDYFTFGENYNKKKKKNYKKRNFTIFLYFANYSSLGCNILLENMSIST